MSQDRASVHSWTELHRHLDLSTRIATVYELAQKYKLEAQSTSLESFREKVLIRGPSGSLEETLEKFAIYQRVLQRPEDLKRLAYEAAADAHAEGLSGVEFRFSPAFVCEFSKLSWADVLEGFETGLKAAAADFSGLRTGLICIITREYGVDEAHKVIEFFHQNASRFIGIDLAGKELGFPCRLFKDVFKTVHTENITIHAGESMGPENVWEAIELLGAKRIGHGIQSIQDPELMRVLAEREICLEICPTSNFLTEVVPDVSQHPIRKMLEQGVPVTINTDDPGIFDLTFQHELRIAREVIGLSEKQLGHCRESSQRYSFL